MITVTMRWTGTRSEWKDIHELVEAMIESVTTVGYGNPDVLEVRHDDQ